MPFYTGLPFLFWPATWIVLPVMILNYFKVALRSLRASKTFSFINIGGLSIGIAASVLIMMVIMHEFSYDHFHAKGDRIFRAEKQFTRDGRHSLFANPLFAAALSDVDPRVESYVRTFDGSGRILSSDQQHVFFEDRFMFAENSFFHIFSFPLLQGDAMALTQPSTAVITESHALKYFGTTDVIGKTITLDKTYPLTITGLAKDPPLNSTIQFGIIASFETLTTMPFERNLLINNSSGFPTYVLLRDKNDLEDVSKSIVTTQYTNPNIIYSLAPLYENHFNFNFGSTATSKYAYTFLSIAALILLLALINYMNLTTARATTRAREVGVRKVIGARRSSLSFQFYFESGVTTFFSFVVALVLIEVCRPLLTDILGLTLDASFLRSPLLYGAIVILLVLCVIVAGSYPALVLPSFKPADVLKGNIIVRGSDAWFRKVLTIFQFSVSLCLAICSVIMTSQLSYMGSFNTGMDRERVIAVSVKTLTPSQRRSFKTEIAGKSGVEAVSIASLPLYKNNMSGVSYVTSPFNDQKVGAKWMVADADFVKTLRLTPESYSKGSAGTHHLLNESAAGAFGLTDTSMTRSITMGGDHVPAVTGDISGVVSDFNYESLRNPIQPLILSIVADSASYIGDDPTIYVRTSEGTVPSAIIAEIGSTYAKLSDGTPFTYFFLDDAFNQQQLNDRRLHQVFVIFSIIALLIASMGLFGLITFSSERRKKELSIRKLLGATIGNIIAHVSSEMTALLAISILIAIPAALYFSREWLSGFFYQTSITLYDVVVPVGSAVLSALGVIVIKGINVAVTNPVKNLKND
jgi:putative ABC transport system permease protein